jgi:hypothetical protein
MNGFLGEAKADFIAACSFEDTARIFMRRRRMVQHSLPMGSIIVVLAPEREPRAIKMQRWTHHRLISMRNQTLER